MRISRSGSGHGSLGIRTASTTENIAVVAPMPKARTKTLDIAKVGRRAQRRMVCWRVVWINRQTEGERRRASQLAVSMAHLSLTEPHFREGEAAALVAVSAPINEDDTGRCITTDPLQLTS